MTSTKIETISFDSFAESTTLHGVQYFSSKTSVLRKVAWTAIMLGVASFSIANVIDVLQQYLRHESYYMFTRSHPHSDDGTETGLEYPALTVCNLNMLNATALDEVGSVLTTFFIPPWGINLSETTKRQLSQINVMETFNKTGYTLDETFVLCGIGSDSTGTIPCREYVTPLLRNQGKCHTFNGPKIARRLKATGSGINQGVRLVLDTNSKQFLTSTRNAEGFSLVIHEPQEMPDLHSKSMLLHPGELIHVGIKKVITKALKKPYSQDDCLTDTREAEKRIYNSMKYYDLPYSQSLCNKQCLVHEIAYENVCSLFPNGTSDCSFLHYVEKAFFNFQKIRAGKISPSEICHNCLANCTTTEYPRYTSYAAFPNSAAEKEIVHYRPQYNTREKMRANILELNVYYETLEVTTMKQIPTITPSQLWSNFGGLIGLTLGASFITVAEFLDFCVMQVLGKWLKAKAGVKVEAVEGNRENERVSSTQQHLETREVRATCHSV